MAAAARRAAALARHLLEVAPELQLRASPVAGEDASSPAAELYAVRRQGHSVPKSLREAGGSAVTFFENHARRLSHAEKARTVLAASGTGTLSTLHHESGWPYGSIVNFATEKPAEGPARVLFFVSRLAEHTANITADPRASLLVSAVQGSGDRLATARATFMAEAVAVEKTDSAKQAFLAAHPQASYVHYDDFLCFELQVRSIRYIGGFGEMSWVGGEAFATAEADPIAADGEAARAAVQHCNADHADAVLEMARALSGLREAQSATMLSVDRYGFDVLCQMLDGLRRSRVEFRRRLERGDSLREAIVKATQHARSVLADNA